MRLALSLAAFFLLVPSDAAADPIPAVEMEFRNSDLTFGFVNPDQTGWDLDGLWLSGEAVEFSSWGPFQLESTFDALSGPLVEQTLVRDTNGTVIASRYFYEGGTFTIGVAGWDGVTGEQSVFVAPIVTLEIHVLDELITAPCDLCSTVDVFYEFGPGLFDASVASALGIGRRTSGGEGYGGLGLTDFSNRPGTAGTYTSPERQAQTFGGSMNFTFNPSVPEPPIAILSVLGLSAAWLRRRWSMGTDSH